MMRHADLHRLHIFHGTQKNSQLERLTHANAQVIGPSAVTSGRRAAQKRTATLR